MVHYVICQKANASTPDPDPSTRRADILVRSNVASPAVPISRALPFRPLLRTGMSALPHPRGPRAVPARSSHLNKETPLLFSYARKSRERCEPRRLAVRPSGLSAQPSLIRAIRAIRGQLCHPSRGKRTPPGPRAVPARSTPSRKAAPLLSGYPRESRERCEPGTARGPRGSCAAPQLMVAAPEESHYSSHGRSQLCNPLPR